jgi:hypothetical protein
LRQITNAEWYEVLFSRVARSPDNALFPFMPLFPALNAEEEVNQHSEHAKELQIDCRNTLEGLAGSGITCPPVDRRLLATYFTAFIRSGFMEAPSAQGKLAGVANGAHTAV